MKFKKKITSLLFHRVIGNNLLISGKIRRKGRKWACYYDVYHYLLNIFKIILKNVSRKFLEIFQSWSAFLIIIKRQPKKYLIQQWTLWGKYEEIRIEFFRPLPSFQSFCWNFHMGFEVVLNGYFLIMFFTTILIQSINEIFILQGKRRFRC